MPKAFMFSVRRYDSKKTGDEHTQTDVGPPVVHAPTKMTTRSVSQSGNMLNEYLSPWQQPGKTNGATRNYVKDKRREMKARSFHHLSLVTRFYLGLRMTRIRSTSRQSSQVEDLNVHQTADHHSRRKYLKSDSHQHLDCPIEGLRFKEGSQNPEGECPGTDNSQCATRCSDEKRYCSQTTRNRTAPGQCESDLRNGSSPVVPFPRTSRLVSVEGRACDVPTDSRAVQDTDIWTQESGSSHYLTLPPSPSRHSSPRTFSPQTALRNNNQQCSGLNFSARERHLDLVSSYSCQDGSCVEIVSSDSCDHRGPVLVDLNQPSPRFSMADLNVTCPGSCSHDIQSQTTGEACLSTLEDVPRLIRVPLICDPNNQAQAFKLDINKGVAISTRDEHFSLGKQENIFVIKLNSFEQMLAMYSTKEMKPNLPDGLNVPTSRSERPKSNRLCGSCHQVTMTHLRDDSSNIYSTQPTCPSGGSSEDTPSGYKCLVSGMATSAPNRDITHHKRQADNEVSDGNLADDESGEIETDKSDKGQFSNTCTNVGSPAVRSSRYSVLDNGRPLKGSPAVHSSRYSVLDNGRPLKGSPAVHNSRYSVLDTGLPLKGSPAIHSSRYSVLDTDLPLKGSPAVYSSRYSVLDTDLPLKGSPRERGKGHQLKTGQKRSVLTQDGRLSMTASLVEDGIGDGHVPVTTSGNNIPVFARRSPDGIKMEIFFVNKFNVELSPEKHERVRCCGSAKMVTVKPSCVATVDTVSESYINEPLSRGMDRQTAETLRCSPQTLADNKDGTTDSNRQFPDVVHKPRYILGHGGEQCRPSSQSYGESLFDIFTAITSDKGKVHSQSSEVDTTLYFEDSDSCNPSQRLSVSGSGQIRVPDYHYTTESSISLRSVAGNKLDTTESSISLRSVAGNKLDTTESSISLRSVAGNKLDTTESSISLRSVAGNKLDTTESSISLRSVAGNKLDTTESSISLRSDAGNKLDPTESNIPLRSVAGSKLDTTESNIPLRSVAGSKLDTTESNIPLRSVAGSKLDTTESNIPLRSVAGNKLDPTESNIPLRSVAGSKLDTTDLSIPLRSVAGNKLDTTDSSIPLRSVAGNKLDTTDSSIPLRSVAGNKLDSRAKHSTLAADYNIESHQVEDFDQCHEPQQLNMRQQNDQCHEPQPLNMRQQNDQRHESQPLNMRQHQQNDQHHQPQPLNMRKHQQNDQHHQPQPLNIRQQNDQPYRFQPLNIRQQNDQPYQFQPLNIRQQNDQPYQFQQLNIRQQNDQRYQPQPLNIRQHNDQSHQPPPLNMHQQNIGNVLQKKQNSKPLGSSWNSYDHLMLPAGECLETTAYQSPCPSTQAGPWSFKSTSGINLQLAFLSSSTSAAGARSSTGLTFLPICNSTQTTRSSSYTAQSPMVLPILAVLSPKKTSFVVSNPRQMFATPASNLLRGVARSPASSCSPSTSDEPRFIVGSPMTNSTTARFPTPNSSQASQDTSSELFQRFANIINSPSAAVSNLSFRSHGNDMATVTTTTPGSCFLQVLNVDNLATTSLTTENNKDSNGATSVDVDNNNLSPENVDTKRKRKRQRLELDQTGDIQVAKSATCASNNINSNSKRPRSDNMCPLKRLRSDNMCPLKRSRSDNMCPLKRPRSDNMCPLCCRMFTRSWLLKGHMRTHTGERPYHCHHPTCGKAFADRSNLRSHMLIHSSEAHNFTCPKCDRNFSQKRYLHKHSIEVCKISADK